MLLISRIHSEFTKTPYAFVVQYPTIPNHGKILLVPKNSNLQWQLRPLVFLPDNEGHIDPCPLYFPSILWKGKVELPNECHDERVQFDNAESNGRCHQFESVRHIAMERSLEAYANRHPMQPLGPPEKLELHQSISAHRQTANTRDTHRLP